MNPSSVTSVGVSKPNPVNHLSLDTRLKMVTNILKINGFNELGFVSHDEIDWAPTVVLVGKYETKKELDLFMLLDTQKVKRLLPESCVVESSHRDEDSPNHTILERRPEL